MDVLESDPNDGTPAAPRNERGYIFMTGAMYAAISGMKAHMGKLNVIGNNVANVNTNGYKAGTALFAESIYTTTKAGSNGGASTGGTNPIQIGYGCSISTISLDMSTKNYVPTGDPRHLMVSGDGFFMLGTKDMPTPVKPESLSLSRVGDFKFDEEGYLTDGRGNIVYGFMNCSNTPAGGVDANYQPAGTAAADHTTGVSTTLAPIRLPMKAQDGKTLYPGIVGGVVTDATADPTAGAAGGPTERISLTSISIGEKGEIMGINGDTKEPVVVGYVPLASVANPSGVTHMGGPYYQAMGGAGKVRVASVGGSVKGKLNDAQTTDAAAESVMTNSGAEYVPGGLESSGTDVATEFSEMITTQRGYQANTRIITVTDSMLEELVNIKR